MASCPPIGSSGFGEFPRPALPGVIASERAGRKSAAVLVELLLFGLAAIIVASVISVIAPG
jgi:hypothetical protein